MLTMLIGGLWHGASWTFVAWGALHGFYLIIERLLKGKVQVKTEGFQGMLVALATFMYVNITWVFFRANDFGEAMAVLSSMFTFTGEGARVIGYVDIWVTLGVVTLLFASHWWMRHHTLAGRVENRQNLVGICWALMLVLIIVAQGSGEQFVYFQF